MMLSFPREAVPSDDDEVQETPSARAVASCVAECDGATRGPGSAAGRELLMLRDRAVVELAQLLGHDRPGAPPH